MFGCWSTTSMSALLAALHPSRPLLRSSATRSLSSRTSFFSTSCVIADLVRNRTIPLTTANESPPLPTHTRRCTLTSASEQHRCKNATNARSPFGADEDDALGFDPSTVALASATAWHRLSRCWGCHRSRPHDTWGTGEHPDGVLRHPWHREHWLHHSCPSRR